MVQYVKVPAGKNIYYRVPIPEVKQETPYQIWGFEYPEENKLYSSLNRATLRTVIKNNERYGNKDEKNK